VLTDLCGRSSARRPRGPGLFSFWRPGRPGGGVSPRRHTGFAWSTPRLIAGGAGSRRGDLRPGTDGSTPACARRPCVAIRAPVHRHGGAPRDHGRTGRGGGDNSYNNPPATRKRTGDGVFLLAWERFQRRMIAGWRRRAWAGHVTMSVTMSMGAPRGLRAASICWRWPVAIPARRLGGAVSRRLRSRQSLAATRRRGIAIGRDRPDSTIMARGAPSAGQAGYFASSYNGERRHGRLGLGRKSPCQAGAG